MRTVGQRILWSSEIRLRLRLRLRLRVDRVDELREVDYQLHYLGLVPSSSVVVLLLF